MLYFQLQNLLECTFHSTPDSYSGKYAEAAHRLPWQTLETKTGIC